MILSKVKFKRYISSNQVALTMSVVCKVSIFVKSSSYMFEHVNVIAILGYCMWTFEWDRCDRAIFSRFEVLTFLLSCHCFYFLARFAISSIYFYKILLKILYGIKYHACQLYYVMYMQNSVFKCYLVIFLLFELKKENNAILLIFLFCNLCNNLWILF